MQLPNVVLLQGDPGATSSLVAVLSHSFRNVQVVRSLGELHKSIAKHRAGVVILDMELAPLNEVQQLARAFPGLPIVCTHRLADEELWTAAVNAGAVDVSLSDPHAILTTTLRNVPAIRRAAA